MTSSALSPDLLQSQGLSMCPQERTTPHLHPTIPHTHWMLSPLLHHTPFTLVSLTLL